MNKNERQPNPLHDLGASEKFGEKSYVIVSQSDEAFIFSTDLDSFHGRKKINLGAKNKC